MKKFILGVCIIVLCLFIGFYAYYVMGMYVDVDPGAPVTTFMKADEDTIYMERGGEYVPFEIRGVNMGVGIPGEWATDYAIDVETYKRWFGYIQDLGANTIRVYTILQDDFYNAFYEYNTAREEAGEEPLWLIHGVWVNDYVQFSHRDAYDDEFLQTLLEDSRTLVDILHGKRVLSLGRGLGSGSYRKDVSPWVIGYILGVEWEDVTVAYTDQKYPERSVYEGKYMCTEPGASPFEAMLAQAGDNIIEYESTRYKQQRLIAFSNWPTTDPFYYSPATTFYRSKYSSINVENITPTENFISGYFASYHVYAYYPDYLELDMEAAAYREEDLIEAYGESRYENILKVISNMGAADIYDYIGEGDYYDSQGRLNTYRAYLSALNNFHNIPVVISEYGVTTGRGMAQVDRNTNRNQGHMTEQEQGQALVDCYIDIMDTGSAGSCVFTWQDEWFKRTWNTMHAVDLDRTPYWSDYQTNEQYFGLLTFDPGWEQSVSYTDGDPSEWTEGDLVWSGDEGDLYMKYDEKFLYFYYDGDARSGPVYIPIDTTPKSGSTYCKNYDLHFDRGVDFVISIDGEDNSRVVVQERYEVLRAMFSEEYYKLNAYFADNIPDTDTPVFKEISLPLILENLLPPADKSLPLGERYETGKLRMGNGNPESADFDSLTDFCFTPEGGVEIRIPWQLLNFADPSVMNIHDDYYEHYGIEYIQIEELYVGVCTVGGASRVQLAPLALEGWGNDPTYHERLKESYYILRDYWAGLD